jgi:hypothetical protein
MDDVLNTDEHAEFFLRYPIRFVYSFGYGTWGIGRTWDCHATIV